MPSEHDKTSKNGHAFAYFDGPGGFGNYCRLCNLEGPRASETQLKAMAGR